MFSWIKERIVLVFVRLFIYFSIFYFDLLAKKRWAILTSVALAALIIVLVILLLEGLAAKRQI